MKFPKLNLHLDYVAASRDTYPWYADYLHQIQPYVKIVNDIETCRLPKYKITENSIEMIDDGLSPEDRETVKAAERYIEMIRQRFEDKFYYEARRNNRTTGFTYPGAEGRDSPVDPGNGP